MPASYAIELLFAADRADAVLDALADRLVPDQAARLRAALPWRPVELADGVGRGIAGIEGELVPTVSQATVVYPDDEALADLAGDLGLPHRGGRVEVSNHTLTIAVGSRHGHVSLFSHGRRMNQVFCESPSIAATWRSLARDARLDAALLSCEDEAPWRALWPNERTIPLREVETLWRDRHDVDTRAAVLIRACTR